MDGSESFNLHQTVAAAGQAFQAVVCHIFFDAGLHGLAMALVLGLVGVVLYKRKHRLGLPFMAVCRRLSIFCGVLIVPGLITLISAGHLPSTGVLSINSLGLVVFWSLICVHLSAEEMNYQWF